MSNRPKTGEEHWRALGTTHDQFLRRAETLADLTLPHLVRDQGQPSEQNEDATDYMSIGAVAVNSLVGRMLTALFGKAFFKINPSQAEIQQLQSAGIPGDTIEQMVAEVERECMASMDNGDSRIRQTLVTMLQHDIALGQVCLDLTDPDDLCIVPIRCWRIKRNRKGTMAKLVVCECMPGTELEPDALEAAKAGGLNLRDDEDEVKLYRVVCRLPGGKFQLDQYVNDIKLPDAFTTVFAKESDVTLRVVGSSVSPGQDYCTGHAEMHLRDLLAASVLAKCVTEGAVIGCEVRYAIDKSSGTRAQDWNSSKNGEAIDGSPSSIAPVTANNSQAVQIASAQLQAVEARINRAFLVTSGAVRDSERTTAEEVRALLRELTEGLGPWFTAFGPDAQAPLARWLIRRRWKSSKGIDLKITTGIDALSRQGEATALIEAMQDLSVANGLSPTMQARLKAQDFANAVGRGRGVDLAKYFLSDQQAQAAADQARQGEVNQANAIAAGQAAANSAQQGTLTQ